MLLLPVSVACAAPAAAQINSGNTALTCPASQQGFTSANGISCDPSNLVDSCWISILDYMDTEFDYTDRSGVRYTGSSTPNSSRNTAESSAALMVPGPTQYIVCDKTQPDCARCAKDAFKPGGTDLRIECKTTWRDYANACPDLQLDANGAPLQWGCERASKDDEYWRSTKTAYYNPPGRPGVRYMSKMQYDGFTPEIWRYDNNSIYIISEPRFYCNRYAGYWQHPGGTVHYGDRGYFWFFNAFPLKPVGGGVWRSHFDFNGSFKVVNPLTGGMMYNVGGYKSSYENECAPPHFRDQGFWEHRPPPEGLQSTHFFAYADFLPDQHDWYNDSGPRQRYQCQDIERGNLPSGLDVLVLTHGTQDSNGRELWMERYFYGRDRRNGNRFGMIRWDSWTFDSRVCPENWRADTASYPGAQCWGQMHRKMMNPTNRLRRMRDYPAYQPDPAVPAAYRYSNLQEYWNKVEGQALVEKQDTKLRKRAGNTAQPPSVGELERSHWRGAFKLLPTDRGTDSKGAVINPGEWVSLETNLFLNDYYLYPSAYAAANGREQPWLDPGSQCRRNYNYLGGFVSSGTWSGLDRSQYNGTGWVVLCGTDWNVYVARGACAAGYTARGSFNTASNAYPCNPAAKTCGPLSSPGGTGSQLVLLCVKDSQVAGNSH